MYILLLIGLALILWCALKTRVYLRARKWHKTQGVLLNVSEGEFKEFNELSPPTFFKYPKAKYEYTVVDQAHLNDKVTFEIRNYFKYENAGDEFWNNWKEGETIDIFYNPSNPTESVIIPYMSKKRRSHYLALFFSGLLLIIAGLLINGA